MALSKRFPRMVTSTALGRKRLSADRELPGSKIIRMPSSAARLVLPTSSAAVVGSPIRSITRLTAWCWVWVMSMMYSMAMSVFPIWRSPWITWSLFMNSWV